MNPTPSTTTYTPAKRKIVWLSIIFAVLLFVLSGAMLGITGRFNLQWGMVCVAAALGSAAGLLGATLDHVNLRVKQDALERINIAQAAYVAVRFSMGLALGLGAAVVTDAALAAKTAASAETALELLCIAAFAAAYLFDISKLSPGK